MTSENFNLLEETAEDLKARAGLTNSYDHRELNLTDEQQEFISSKLSSKLWRLNNLYTIRDKNAVKRTLKLNDAQLKVLTKFKHNKKIILKSRQQGISTLYLAYNLDDCLFKPGYNAGIQSYGLDESDKLSIRARLMWEDLDPNIKELMELKVVSDNQKGITFSNGAILKIGNFRGDTLQSLHVSELAKIAKKFPEKAKELKTGAFQAVSTKNKITIESTAEGKNGLFWEIWSKAETRIALGQALTPLDFQPIFLSWMEDPDCQLDFEVVISSSLNSYFTSLEELLSITLTDKQKWWYSKKKEELSDDMQQEYPSTAEEAFTAAKDGTYYSKMFRDHVIKNKRIIAKLYDENLNVNVAMDLGMNDTMVLIFFQLYRKELRIIDVYYNSGEAIGHYAEVIKSKPYKYDAFIFPHDANVRSLNDAKSRVDIFREHGIRGRVLPRSDVHDGIELVRSWIPYTYIDEDLQYIIETYNSYSKEWNDRTGMWNNKPLHNEWSNPADAIRYMCQSLPKLSDGYKTPERAVYRYKSQGYDV